MISNNTTLILTNLTRLLLFSDSYTSLPSFLCKGCSRSNANMYSVSSFVRRLRQVQYTGNGNGRTNLSLLLCSSITAGSQWFSFPCSMVFLARCCTQYGLDGHRAHATTGHRVTASTPCPTVSGSTNQSRPPKGSRSTPKHAEAPEPVVTFERATKNTNGRLD